jgi:hypothetical protein
MIERAVLDFLEALGPELRREALFPFESAERRNWHYEHCQATSGSDPLTTSENDPLGLVG